jgi:hypothetical protein
MERQSAALGQFHGASRQSVTVTTVAPDISSSAVTLSSGGRRSYPFGLERAFSWRPRLAHNFGRRFGSLTAPFLGFLDTDDATSAKLHRARCQSGLLQLIEKREANADGGAEFLD